MTRKMCLLFSASKDLQTPITVHEWGCLIHIFEDSSYLNNTARSGDHDTTSLTAYAAFSVIRTIDIQLSTTLTCYHEFIFRLIIQV